MVKERQKEVLCWYEAVLKAKDDGPEMLEKIDEERKISDGVGFENQNLRDKKSDCVERKNGEEVS